MQRLSTAPWSRPAIQRPPIGLVIGLTLLAVLQVLHLLDDLRTDPSATGQLVAVFLKPQAVAGIGGAVVAAVLVAIGNGRARRLALLVASLVSLGFLVVHGTPVKAGPFHPYWGAGSADPIQWAGVLLIWTCSAYVIWRARATA